MRRAVWAIAIVTLVLVTVGVLVSSAWPDGLERVAASLGFASRGTVVAPVSPFANYEARFFHSRWAAQVSAGLLGVALLYAFGMLFGRSLRRRKNASRHSG